MLKDNDYHKYLVNKGIEENQAVTLMQNVDVEVLSLLRPFRKDLLLDLAHKSKDPVHQIISKLSTKSKKYQDQLKYTLIAIGFTQI